MNRKEISADQVLTLIYSVVDKKNIVGCEDINLFFDILCDINQKSSRKSRYALAINIPMNGNYDNTLFDEINKGEYKGAMSFVQPKNEIEKKKQIEKLTRNLLVLVGSDTTFMNICSVSLDLFYTEYIKNVKTIQEIREPIKPAIFQKVKGLVTKRTQIMI
jgi:hypothetical protein